MTSIATSLDPFVEDRFVAELLAHGHTIAIKTDSTPELLAHMETTVFTLVVATARARYLTALLIDACDARGIRLLAVANGKSEREYATSLGIFDVLDAAAPWQSIEKTLQGSLTERENTKAHRRNRPKNFSSQVLAVWGPIGSPGTTTLALNIAAETAADGYRVLLIDADVYGSSAAAALGLLDETPGIAAACRLAGNNALSLTELERVACRYESPSGSFWVLTGITRTSRWPELTPEKLEKTIKMCREWVDLVVVDCAFSVESDEEISSDVCVPRRNGATRAVFLEANKIVAVGTPDPIGLPRFLRAYTEIKELVSGRIPLSVVINKVRASVIGSSPATQVRLTVRRFGGIERVAIIPQDQRGIDASLIMGRTLRDCSPRSPALAAIREYVRTDVFPAEKTHKRRLRHSKKRKR